MALLVCRLSSAETGFLPFSSCPASSCPEQPQVFLGKTPYSLDAWGRGTCWSAADLTKAPLPQGKWGPKGNRESGLRLPAQGLGLQSFLNLREPLGEGGSSDPGWSSLSWAPGAN